MTPPDLRPGFGERRTLTTTRRLNGPGQSAEALPAANGGEPENVGTTPLPGRRFSARPRSLPGLDEVVQISAVVRHKHHTSLYHGFQALQVLLKYGRSLGVSEIARELGLAVSTTHDLLATLSELSFVEQNSDTKRYSVSPEIFAFLGLLSNQFGHNSEINRVLRDHCAKQDVTLYVSMLCRNRTYVVCASGSLGDTVTIGANGPVHATSAGKAIVSQLTESEWMKYAPAESEEKLTPYTKRDVELFLKELVVARESGVGWNIRETASGLCSVAAPLYLRGRLSNRAVALVLPFGEWVARDREKLAIEIKGVAARISAALS